MKRGEIYWMNYEYDFEGQHYKQQRPAIIVSNNRTTTNSDYIEIVYLTSKTDHESPLRPTITSAKELSVAKCDEISCVPKDWVGYFIGEATDAEMMKVEVAMAKSVGIEIVTIGSGSRETKTSAIETSGAVEMLQDEVKLAQQACEKAQHEAEIYKDLYNRLLEKLIK